MFQNGDKPYCSLTFRIMIVCIRRALYLEGITVHLFYKQFSLSYINYLFRRNFKITLLCIYLLCLLYLLKRTRWMWQYMPVISTTWEAEAGGPQLLDQITLLEVYTPRTNLYTNICRKRLLTLIWDSVKLLNFCCLMTESGF